MKILFWVALLLGFIDDTRASEWAWTAVGDGEELLYMAYVENRAGDSFGQVCFADNGECFYMLYLGVMCNKDAKFPALINSSVGSYGIELVCMGSFESGYFLALTDFDDADKVAREADKVGFAVSLEGGKFSVNRFNLDGSAEIMDKMIGAVRLAYNRSAEGRALEKKGAE